MLKLLIKITAITILFVGCNAVLATVDSELFAKQTNVENFTTGESPYENIVIQFIQGLDPLIDANKWDREQFNQVYARKISVAPELVVFGTSHASLLQQQNFRNLKIFNHFVAGSDLGTIENIYAIYHNGNKIPQKILLGIDFWYLQEQRTTKPYLFAHGMKQLTLLENVIVLHKMGRSMAKGNFELFQRSFQNVVKLQFPQLFRKPDYPEMAPVMIRLHETLNHDGSAVVKPFTRTQPLDATRFKESLLLTTRLLDRPMSLRQVERFEKLVDQMMADGASVAFILTPLHPIAFNVFANDPIRKVIYSYYVEFAKIHNIPMVGSYDPSECSFKDLDFIDDNHLSADGVDKLINASTCKLDDWDKFLNP
jgi:hypothetical protein